MGPRLTAFTVLAVSAIAGFLLAHPPEPGLVDAWEPQPPGSQPDGLVYGSAHEHALMYVVVNGTELDFLGPRYQLASRYVHLENDNSHIVHKHAEGVTWSFFLETLNVSVEPNNTETCFERGNVSYCGPAELLLNGEPADISREITQGDRLVMVFQENPGAVADNYTLRQLPPAYKPQERRGRRV